MAKKERKPQQRNRLVKVTLTDQQARDVRVAAALEDCSAAEFGRRAIMDRADKLLKQRLR